MKKLLLILIVALSSCSVDEPVAYKEGDKILLKDGRTVIVDKSVPGGYIVYIANKMEVKYYTISKDDIKQ
jgi:hypothetical protein